MAHQSLNGTNASLVLPFYCLFHRPAPGQLVPGLPSPHIKYPGDLISVVQNVGAGRRCISTSIRDAGATCINVSCHTVSLLLFSSRWKANCTATRLHEKTQPFISLCCSQKAKERSSATADSAGYKRKMECAGSAVSRSQRFWTALRLYTV